MFVLSPRPGLASFRRLTHGFTVGYFRPRLPALDAARLILRASLRKRWRFNNFDAFVSKKL
jgi:hypothetical protein